MIRKLIAGLALVGVLAVGGASVVSAETSGPTGTTPTAQSDQKPIHDRVCARANRLVSFLQKWQTQLDNRIAKLQAKQPQVTDPDKAAKLATLITNLQKRSSELKEYTDKIAGAIGEKCPAPTPAPASS